MDETKKALLSIDIDTAALTQNAANAKASVAALADQLKSLKDAGKDSGEAFAQISEQLKKAGEEAKKSQEALKEYGKGLTDTGKAAGDLKAATADLSAQNQKNTQDTAANAASLDVLNQRYSASKTEVAALKQQFQALNDESITLKGTHGSNSAQVRELQTSLLGLSAQIKTAKANSAEYKQAVDDLTASQQNTAKKTEDGKKSITDYTKSVVTAAESHTPFGKTIGQMAQSFNSVKDGAGKVIEGFSNYRKEVSAALDNSKTFNSGAGFIAKRLEALKVNFEVATGGASNFTKALAGTGIGLIIVAVAALIDYLSKFQPVVDKVEQVMAGFNGAIAAGKHMLDEFFGSIKSVGDFFSNLGNFKNFIKVMADAAEQTYKLKRAQQELDEELKQSAGRNTEREVQIARLKAQMLTASLADRKNYEKQIKTLEDARFAESQHLQEKQVNITLARVNAINKLNKDEAFSINNLTEAKIDAVAKARTLDAETVKSLREALKQRDDSRTEFFVKEAKDTQQALAKQTEGHQKQKEAQQKHNQEMEVIRASKARMELAGIHDSYARQVAEINISFNQQKQMYKGQTQVLAQLQKERDKQLDDLAKEHQKQLADKEASEQKTLFDMQTEAAIKAVGSNYQKVYDLRTKQIKADLDFELKQIGISEGEKKIITEKYKQQQDNADKAYDDAKTSVFNKAQIAKLNEALEHDEAELKLNENNYSLKLKAQIKYLDDKYKLDKLNAGTDVALQEKLDKDHQKAKDKLDAEYEQSTKRSVQNELKLINQKTQHYKDHFNQLAGLFSKNTEAGKAAFMAKKALAVAEIAISTEQQVAASISATKNQIEQDSKLSFPLGTILVVKDIALGAIEVASTIANGAKQVSTLNGINPQGFARGGLYLSDGFGTYLKGPGSGTSDSINARLSNGESIINARSTQMFAPILSAINQAGGGRAFTAKGNSSNFALGGIFSGSNSLNDSSTDLANARALNDMAKTMAANMPRQILVVEDVQASLQNKAMLQNMSNF